MSALFQSLPAAAQWAVFGVTLLLSLLSLLHFWRNIDALSFMRTAATSRARSASQGYVELSGRAQLLPGPPIVAPLSRKDCIWYEYQTSGFAVDTRTIIPHEKGRSDAIFYLEDASGRCIIDPDGARVIAGHRERWFGDTHRPELKSFGWKLEWMGWLHHRMQYLEQRIEPGDELYVIGEFESLHEDQHTSQRQEAAAILRSWKSDPARMRQIDSNGDGTVDADEWEAARQEAFTRAALKLHAEGHSQPINILRRPANRHQPFIIAAHSEAVVVKRFRRQAIISGLLFMLGCAVTAQLHWLM
jgi:hypothetical protein